jgi:pyruvate/2-oxoglutarate dehydrogenase complex dihydrolipoamide acyltransferase (E2) component
MEQARDHVAPFTYVDEIDVTNLVKLRNELKPQAQEQGVKLTYLPFIVKAVIAGLRKHPYLNASLDEASQEIVVKNHYNIGIAAATDAGLMVPVVKHADRRSMLGIATEITRLGMDAKDGKIGPDDLGGSTFTITSLGQLGGLFATPIVNYPELAIMGVHEIKKRPVVIDDQIVIRSLMLISLTFDHRIIDGHVGAAFANEVKRLLENPKALMIEAV